MPKFPLKLKISKRKFLTEFSSLANSLFPKWPLFHFCGGVNWLEGEEREKRSYAIYSCFIYGRWRVVVFTFLCKSLPPLGISRGAWTGRGRATEAASSH